MKKFVVIVICFVAALALISAFGCGQKDTATTPEDTATNTATDTNTPTETSTPVPTATPAVFSFDSDLQGWGVPDPAWTMDQALYSPVYDGANGHSANGCLSVTGTFDATTGGCCGGTTGNIYDKGDVELTLGANTDLTGHTITVWIQPPAAMAAMTDVYTAQIYVKNDDTCTPNWGYSSGAWTNLNSATWTQLTFDVDSGVLANGDANKTCIKSIGVQVYRQGAYVGNATYDLTGITILFDDIQY